ncbi:MAG: Tim44-like domain-containing protein [Caldimonas sp.]
MLIAAAWASGAWWGGRHRHEGSVPPAGAPAVRPEALDTAEVLDAARSRFLRLQAAWDAGDVAGLSQLTTPDMLDQLLAVLGTRGSETNRTDIVTLNAELLAIEEVSAAWLASVEFSGLIRESAELGAVPFRELWMLSSSKGGPPFWRLARQQALF